MSGRRATFLAWGLAGLAGALLVSGIVMAMADASELTSPDLLTTAITVAFSAVGALVAKRHPRNAIGWIFLGVAVFSGLGGFAHGYVRYLLGEGGTPNLFARTAAIYAEVSWVPFVLVPPSFLLLLFPHMGICRRAAGGRWRGRLRRESPGRSRRVGLFPDR